MWIAGADICGQGKKCALKCLSVDPFGEGEDQYIAELELQPGDELKYVYDFGDWIEHRLILEEILEPQAKAIYPRIVAQNKPW